MKNKEGAESNDKEDTNKVCNCDEVDGNCVSCVEKKEAVSESSDDKSSCGGVSLSKYEGVSLSPSSSVGVLTKSDDSKAPLFFIGSNDNASESASICRHHSEYSIVVIWHNAGTVRHNIPRHCETQHPQAL